MGSDYSCRVFVLLLALLGCTVAFLLTYPTLKHPTHIITRSNSGSSPIELKFLGHAEHSYPASRFILFSVSVSGCYASSWFWSWFVSSVGFWVQGIHLLCTYVTFLGMWMDGTILAS
ncbi:uncharacterized protein BO72DRAFT_302738 [Aspergillus fijiensis CBS 313.89]|uniref:Uncharacterized protein n=1 Tax=Aspergillus fijiensis CBS 313.89 TaxID=1448319 RepID=A0A8G1RWL1_9EURO|nr:uncharacterized protein BO72DRAFT_302738 [Aspergillus fijiensis CBS 313.89]RAK80353.1 hypothetical protein BO72DRAFT_302738 [Aspergillus fijiensis CBS 313.89]